MRHPIYFTHIFLLALLLALMPIQSAHAQAETEIHCSMNFTALDRDYERNQLRVTWLVDEAPIGYDVVALRLTQDRDVVPEVGTGLDWRKYPMNDGEAYLDVTNLLAGKIILDAMLLDGVGRPCKDSDKGIWLDKSDDEFEWQPPVVTYAIENFGTDHDQGLIRFDINVGEPRYNVIYKAWIDQDGSTIGATKMEVINAYPERVEIPIAGINLRKVPEAIPIKIYVDAWYTDNLKTSVVQEKEGNIPPTPQLGILDKLGKVIMAVLKNQAALAGIMLTLGLLLVVKVYSKNEKQPPKMPYGRPPKNTVIKEPLPLSSQVSGKYPSFSVRIRQATTSSHENVIAVNEFPCIFGRNKHLEHGQTVKNKDNLFLNILHDANVSREHFEIRERYNKLYIVSRSTNGIIVDQEAVAKGEQVPLSLVSPTLVEIGEQTKIELKPA
ncbi:MAG: FHA domain-containing protein [Anaerolineae bacterium]|nr:FHA domain-containing protein [Anaerolineae bacterium]